MIETNNYILKDKKQHSRSKNKYIKIFIKMMYRNNKNYIKTIQQILSGQIKINVYLLKKITQIKQTDKLKILKLNKS